MFFDLSYQQEKENLLVEKSQFVVFIFVVMLLSMFVSVEASAKNKKRQEFFTFDISRQRADFSLPLFAEQANLTLIFPYETVQEIETNKLTGTYTVATAIKKLLVNTGLRPEFNKKGKLINITDKQLNTEGNKMNIKKKSFLAALAALFIGAGANAQQGSAEEGTDGLEEIVVIGSRKAEGRSIADSPVPVDVISSQQLTSIGGAVDITDALQSLIPSYTATPLTGDASSFVRTTTLRGLAPDQTLVLVNGKRRHRSALVQFEAIAAGKGSHAPDVAMIPSIALKNVQVLRDGAAAQYGSDAIAGVMNFQLKDDAEGGSFMMQYGEHFEGEQNLKFAGNLGMALGSDGFFNLSFEHIDNDALSRGIQREAAQNLIDAGVQGVGTDSPFDDAPLTHTWGRPESSGTRVFFNSGIELSDNAEFYSFGNYAQTTARTRFFYRPGSLDGSGDEASGTHSTIRAFAANNPGFGANPYPAGYTPFFDGDQTDFSFITGLKGVFANDLNYDFSVSYGKNKLEYTLNNTLNPSLIFDQVAGATLNDVQRNFDVGGHAQEETNFNADFSKALSESLNLAFGAEWREETFIIIEGEKAAYFGSGTSGFGAPSDLSSGKFSRDNVAFYVDLEHDVTDSWLMQYALRAEDFSDFGSTANFKIATNFDVSDTTSLRGAISTGFHAPTPGQSNIRALSTTIDPSSATSELILVGTVPADSPEAAEIGGAPLKEEESTSISIGAVLNISDNTDLTIDAYSIEVEDRIFKTPNINVPVLPGETPGDRGRRSIFVNAFDMESQGLDVVLTSQVGIAEIIFAYSYNTVDISNRNADLVDDDLAEDIENNFPEHRFTLTGNMALSDRLSLMLRGRYFGEHYDERGNISGTASAGQSAEIDPILYVDMELNLDVNENLTFALGANNLFDEYPDELRASDGVANRENVGLIYPRRSPVGYDGGSYYLRASYNF